jgi:hypothetical protein
MTITARVTSVLSLAVNKRASGKAARFGGFLAQAGIRRDPSDGRSQAGVGRR